MPPPRATSCSPYFSDLEIPAIGASMEIPRRTFPRFSAPDTPRWAFQSAGRAGAMQPAAFIGPLFRGIFLSSAYRTHAKRRNPCSGTAYVGIHRNKRSFHFPDCETPAPARVPSHHDRETGEGPGVFVPRPPHPTQRSTSARLRRARTARTPSATGFGSSCLTSLLAFRNSPRTLTSRP